MNRGRIIILGEVLHDLVRLPAGYEIKKIRAVSDPGVDPPVLVLEIEGPRIPAPDETDPFADLPTIRMRYFRDADVDGWPVRAEMDGLEPEAGPVLLDEGTPIGGAPP